jgi:cytochrome P450
MSARENIDPRFDKNPTLPGVSDPYPIFHAVREADPIHWCTGANLWAVMRYDDAQTVLKHPRLSRQAYLDTLEARSGPQPITAMQRHELVFMDNPRHEKLRRLITGAINAQSVHELQAKTDALVAQKITDLLPRGKFDVLADLVHSLPTTVAAAWLGVPDEDRERVTARIFPLVSGRGVARDPKTTAAASAAAKELRA